MAPPSPQQPTIVFVPGSFAPTKLYEPWLTNARNAGLHIEIISTPSVGRKPAGQAPGSMTDDANAIIHAASPLLDAGKQVILLTHSYGGLPGTQSLAQLSSKARSAAGKTGGIDTVIYLTSIVLPVGGSSWAMSNGQLPPSVSIDAAGEYMVLDPVLNAPACFNDLPQEEALLTARGFSEHSVASFKEELTYPGYADVAKVVYVLCKDDLVIPPEAQQGMIGMVNGIRGEGREVVEVKIKSGHCPTHSKPDELTKIVKEVVEQGY